MSQPNLDARDSISQLSARFSVTSAITDEMVQEARSMVGVPLRVEQWNTEASRDNIRHYALGLGDLNPLWHDEDYGHNSIHHSTLAPPTFLYSVYCGLAPGLGGLPVLLTGAKWRFLAWVKKGDQIRAAAQIDAVKSSENRRGHKRILQVGRLDYFRVKRSGSRTKLAECVQVVVRTPGPGHDGALTYEAREPYRYTDAELADIETAVLRVQPRGAQPRYWEEVLIGDNIEQVVKGPYTRMSMVCYYAGAPGSPGYRTFDAWWRNRHLAFTKPEALPSTFPPEYFAGIGASSMGHHDVVAARTIGMPGIYDNGNQRIGLMATAVTNWMSDAGFLYEYEHDIRRPVILGDTLYMDGRVVDKPTDQPPQLLRRSRVGFGQIRVELRAQNQLGETVSTGAATVLLPKRDTSPAVTDGRSGV